MRRYQLMSNIEGVARLLLLPPFQYLVMKSIVSLEDSAYPAEITRTLSLTENRIVSANQVAACLKALKRKNFIDVSQGENANGRTVTLYSITKLGQKALSDTESEIKKN